MDWNPGQRRCSWWHILVWLAYVALLGWSIELMVGHWRSGQAAPLLWLLVLLQGIVIPMIAGGCADRWLDGGNRWRPFRVALGCTALLSAGFAMLWLRYGCTFLLAGVLRGFQAPLARFSLTVFTTHLVMGTVALAAYGAFVWLSLRTAYLLFLTTKPCDLDLIFEQRRHHPDLILSPAARPTPAPVPLSEPVPAPAPSPPPAVNWDSLSDAQRAAILRTAADLVVPYYSQLHPEKLAHLHRCHPELDHAGAQVAIGLATEALRAVDAAYYNLGCGPPLPDEVDPEPALRARYSWLSHDALQLAKGVALNNARRG